MERAPARALEVYGLVLRANRAAVAAVKAGATGKAVDAVARNLIDEAGYKDYFGHGLGHGVGLAVHEAPRLSPLKEEPLSPGMVFTVEPGIYIPEWGGIRIENMVAVREDGPEVLNRLDTQLRVIKSD